MSEAEGETRKERLGIETPDEKLDAQWMPRDEIEPNEWNPNEMDEEDRKLLRESILNQGWTQPVVVHAEDHYIIDGEQRWTVAGHPDIALNEELTPEDVPAGYVPVFGITVEEERAKVSTIQHNRARGFVNYNSLYDYFMDFADEGKLDDLIDELAFDEEQALRIVDDQKVSEAISTEHEVGPAWEPRDISEFDDSEIERSTRSESLKNAATNSPSGTVESERIPAVLSERERDLVEGTLSEDAGSDALIAYANYLDENDLIENFWAATGVQPDEEEYPHPNDIVEDDDEADTETADEEPDEDEDAEESAADAESDSEDTES